MRDLKKPLALLRTKPRWAGDKTLNLRTTCSIPKSRSSGPRETASFEASLIPPDASSLETSLTRWGQMSQKRVGKGRPPLRGWESTALGLPQRQGETRAKTPFAEKPL